MFLLVVHTYPVINLSMGITPHEGIGTQVMQNGSKGNAVSEDREMGNGVDIARIERVYRYFDRCAA